MDSIAISSSSPTAPFWILWSHTPSPCSPVLLHLLHLMFDLFIRRQQRKSTKKIIGWSGRTSQEYPVLSHALILCAIWFLYGCLPLFCLHHATGNDIRSIVPKCKAFTWASVPLLIFFPYPHHLYPWVLVCFVKFVFLPLSHISTTHSHVLSIPCIHLSRYSYHHLSLDIYYCPGICVNPIKVAPFLYIFVAVKTTSIHFQSEKKTREKKRGRKLVTGAKLLRGKRSKGHIGGRTNTSNETRLESCVLNILPPLLYFFPPSPYFISIYPHRDITTPSVPLQPLPQDRWPCQTCDKVLSSHLSHALTWAR